MNWRNTLKTVSAALLFLGVVFATGNTVAQQPSAMDAVKAANQSFYTALSARDIGAMQKVWSNENDVINMGPRHKSANVGWADTRKSFEGTFDFNQQMAISIPQPQIRVNGQVAWVTGIEQGQVQLKGGEKRSTANFVTNVFENQGGRWLMVSHHASVITQ